MWSQLVITHQLFVENGAKGLIEGEKVNDEIEEKQRLIQLDSDFIMMEGITMNGDNILSGWDRSSAISIIQVR